MFVGQTFPFQICRPFRFQTIQVRRQHRFFQTKSFLTTFFFVIDFSHMFSVHCQCVLHFLQLVSTDLFASVVLLHVCMVMQRDLFDCIPKDSIIKEAIVNICGSYRSVIVLTPASCANGNRSDDATPELLIITVVYTARFPAHTPPHQPA